MGASKRAKYGQKQQFLRALVGTPETDCIRWPFKLDRHGYGYISYAGQSRMSANRAILIMRDGEARNGLVAAHNCGNRWCVNPNHIYWASYKQNSEDRKRHGTFTEGADAPAAVLSADDAVRVKYDRALTAEQAAEKYGISVSSVGKIRSGDIYRRAEEQSSFSLDEIKKLTTKRAPGWRSTPVMKPREVERRLKVVATSRSRKQAAERLGLAPSSLSTFLKNYAPDLVRTYARRSSKVRGQSK